MRKKVYRGVAGKRGGNGERERGNIRVTVNNVTLQTSSNGNTNFDWGKNCQGSYNLAYAILYDFFEDVKEQDLREIKTLKYTKRFQEKVINDISFDSWVLPDWFIQDRVNEIDQKLVDQVADLAEKSYWDESLVL